MEEALVFPTTHHMLTSESLLKREGYRIRLVPAPPGAGQVCSTAIAVASSDADRVVELLESEGVPVSAVLPYMDWRERGARAVLEKFALMARPYPEVATSLEKAAAGERLGRVEIQPLLASETGGLKIVQGAAEELTRFLSSNRVAALVEYRLGMEADISILEELVKAMREAGYVYLLLNLGDEDGFAWPAEALNKVLGDDIIPISCASHMPRDAGRLVHEYGIRQVLEQDGRARRLIDDEIVEEIVFLQDTRPGPVGSGNLLPLLSEAEPDSGKDMKTRLEIITAACRLALGGTFLPAAAWVWRDGLPAGVDMALIETHERAFADVNTEAEEFLKWHGWEFARGRR